VVGSTSSGRLSDAERRTLTHRSGVVGGPLLAASGIAVLLGVIPQGSALRGIATVPEIVWEAFLGLWLTFKGFSSAPITSNYPGPIGVREAFPEAAAAAV
jgi:hypothetical protein